MAKTTSETANKKKGTPTPKRKDAEKQNLRPIVPETAVKKKTPKKAMTPEEKEKYEAEKKAQKLKNQELRLKQQTGYKNGEERYLPEKDRGPVRKFIRSWIDSKRFLSEWFLPVALILLIASSLLTSASPEAGFIITLLVYAYLVLVVLELAIRNHQLKKALAEKFGEAKNYGKMKGNLSYFITRASQMRFSRLPKHGA